MKEQHIQVLYNNGHINQVFFSALDSNENDLTLHGHFRKMVEAKRKGEPYYEAKKILICLDRVTEIYFFDGNEVA